jgi:hypothetical protein
MIANEANTLRPRNVSCPACGGLAVYAASNAYRPFCSSRCRGLDLGSWASESFCLSAGSADPDNDLRQATAHIGARLSDN